MKGMKGEDKPKGGLLAILAGKPKMGDDEEMEGEGDGMESAKMTAAEDAIAALKSGDASALSDALQRHYDACSGMGDSEESGEY